MENAVLKESVTVQDLKMSLLFSPHLYPFLSITQASKVLLHLLT